MMKFDKRFSKIYSSKSCSDFTRSVQKSKEKPTKHEYDKVKKAYTELGGVTSLIYQVSKMRRICTVFIKILLITYFSQWFLNFIERKDVKDYGK